MPKIADFRFDETTWKSGTPLRRGDWKVLLDDLVAHGDFAGAVADRHLLATVTTESVLFEALDSEGHVRHETRLELSLLAEVVREYGAIVLRLDQAEHKGDITWFETMDMAKKVVHDRATSILSRAMGSVCDDPSTLRLLFSLLFALMVDTTTMEHARGHRAP